VLRTIAACRIIRVAHSPPARTRANTLAPARWHRAGDPASDTAVPARSRGTRSDNVLAPRAPPGSPPQARPRRRRRRLSPRRRAPASARQCGERGIARSLGEAAVLVEPYCAWPPRVAGLCLQSGRYMAGAICKVGARRRTWLAPGGFRAPPSEPGVHLSLCTGLSTEIYREGWRFQVPSLSAG
jgi:hypothetical protein